LKATFPTRALPIAFLLALSLGFFYPAIFQGKTFYAFDVLQNHPPWQSNQSPNNTLITDPINIFYPAHLLYQQAIQEGELPFWNHKIFSGTTHTPYFGSPLHYLLFSTLPITSAHDLMLFLHMAGMALMMFLYLKSLHLLTPAALLGAISWMFNGYLMVWFEFENAAMMALTLPGALYFIERWFNKQSPGNFLGLSIFLSLAICAGYAHLLIYQLLLIGVYVIARYVALNPGLKKIKVKEHARILSGPAGALVVGLLAGALFISSHLSFVDEGHREDIPYAQLHESTGKLPARYLITMIFPDFYGSPTRRHGYVNFVPIEKINAYPYNNYNELCIYAGIVTILFAIIGAIYCRLLPGGRFFVITYFTCLAVAMGSIIYWPLAKFIPGLGLSTPTRILYISAFCVTVLASFGLQIVLAKSYHARWPSVLVAAALATITLAAVLLMQEPAIQRAAIEDWLQAYNIPWSNLSGLLAQHYSFTSTVLYLPLGYVTLACLLLFALLYAPTSRHPLILAAIFALLVVDQVTYSRNYNSLTDRGQAYPQTPGIEFLKDDPSLFRVASMPQFLLNGMSPFDIEDVGGYASFFPRRYGELIELSANKELTDLSQVQLKQWYSFSSLASPILSMLNTKYFLATPGAKLLQNETLHLVYQGEMDIYENKQVMARAYFVPQAIHVASRKEAYEVIASFSHEDFRQNVILETPGIGKKPAELDFSSGEGFISELKYRPNEITLSADVPHDGYLVVTTNYHPNWKVELETEQGSRVIAPLLANYSSMAIPLEAGKQSIRFSFHSDWQMMSIAISALTWICLLLFTLGYVLRLFIRSANIDKQSVNS